VSVRLLVVLLACGVLAACGDAEDDAPTVAAAEVEAMIGEEGRAPVSRERFDAMEADVVMGTSPDAAALEKLQEDELFRRLDFARRDAFVPLDIATATSMAFPSVLSVPYSVEQIVPRLAEAVA
jgi:ABC-type Fe3+-hydroxamate transport system substrate-binding protein